MYIDVSRNTTCVVNRVIEKLLRYQEGVHGPIFVDSKTLKLYIKRHRYISRTPGQVLEWSEWTVKPMAWEHLEKKHG